MTDDVAATAARALVSSGLLGPPAPAAVLRLIREVYRGGTNLYTLFAIAAARWPDRTAIIDDDGALSYRELQSKIESLARELYRDDARCTDKRSAIMCRNGRDFVAAVFATGLVGADIVLVNTEFRADALARCVEFAPESRRCSATTNLPNGYAMPASRSGSSIRQPCRPSPASRGPRSRRPGGSCC